MVGFGSEDIESNVEEKKTMSWSYMPIASRQLRHGQWRAGSHSYKSKEATQGESQLMWPATRIQRVSITLQASKCEHSDCNFKAFSYKSNRSGRGS